MCNQSRQQLKRQVPPAELRLDAEVVSRQLSLAVAAIRNSLQEFFA